jgi:SMI1 / KNR4 family (SUKH-1)
VRLPGFDLDKELNMAVRQKSGHQASDFDWEHFLRQWSREMIESIGDEWSKLPLKVKKSGWLGYAGATEEQISAAEARIGMALPPSYRSFLKVSNGWRQTTPFIHKIWSLQEIEWFAVRHHLWIEAFSEKLGYLSSEGVSAISDEEYFVYGDEQDCSRLRIEYLSTALEISKRGEGAIYLLNPQVINSEGEWEAWFFGDWLPGSDRYPSFQAMMQAEYKNFLELREVIETSTIPIGVPTIIPKPDPRLFAEEPVTLEISQLRVHSFSSKKPIIFDKAHLLFPDAIQQGEPFTLEVAMHVVTQANLAEQPLVYRAQCVAYHLATHTHTLLGDISLDLPGDRIFHTTLFPNVTLPQPGMYRLKVWVMLENISALPSYFQVPMLQVV